MTDNSDDLTYYRRRAEQERARAAADGRAHVRRVHLELAERYAARSLGITDADPVMHALGKPGLSRINHH